MTRNSMLSTLERLQSSATRLAKHTSSARNNYLGSTLNPNIVKSQSSLLESSGMSNLGIHQSHRKTTSKLFNAGPSNTKLQQMNAKLSSGVPSSSAHTKSQSELLFRLKNPQLSRKTTLMGKMTATKS